MSASALGRGALLGWWNITSFHAELEDTGECVDAFGVDPLGHLVISHDRMMSILTSRERADKDPAALFETMIAYSGSCRIEDDAKLVIKVDAAWHPAWVGSEQVRFFKVDGDTLSMTTAWQTHPKFPRRMARGVLTAQRL
ncbi:lipocalin-like domain-containing protein [Mesorhizobium sp. ORM8.1]